MTERLADLSALLATAERLAQDDALPEPVRARLRQSVVRPFLLAARRHSARAASLAGSAPHTSTDTLWELARDATAHRVEQPDLLELVEATAALQDLALAATDEPAHAERRGELERLQRRLRPEIRLARGGPLLVTNAAHVYDWLGRPLPAMPQLALCRCGESRIKPFCDGSHASNGFDDAKDPKRVRDRRDSYVGQQVTVLDNRGLCQHSGFCSDRLATVFHPRSEPFVTPSGGRMDEIVRAVRDCPSGALSFALDSVEARDAVDWHDTREQAIVVSKDGPYRVTGSLPLVDQSGSPVERNHGASLEHYALCRCGHSQNKPFCSGVHWSIQFTDPPPAEQPTIFEWAGGLPALTRMTRIFYEKYVPEDPLLAPLFANMAADHPQRVAAWLAEVFSGPDFYSSRYGGYPRMLAQHLGRNLSEDQRSRWVALLLQSAREAGLPNDAEFRAAFSNYIEWGTRLAVENSKPGAQPPQQMPMPHWTWQTAAGAPGARIDPNAPQPEPAEQGATVIPARDQPVSFERHIKLLFREGDRRSMQFAFDLWSHDDVAAHADAILTQLQAGRMPCDGAWPQDRIDLFQRWIAEGTPA